MNAALRRIALSTFKTTTLMSSRGLATTVTKSSGVCLNELRGVLEEYRQDNYSYEVPMRFKKELVAAACQKQAPQEGVRVEGLQQVLSNIGLQDRISPGELKVIFQEEGDASGTIAADRLVRML
uniref:Uncharacterized protein n=1 Tax=Entomoneis paludosa TaxID=265537 RepID=A0A7S2Y913_9STRA|mmetsp:Transcript_23059/g.48078  ORF Transcript_23059/g.48078 Transcript_23059/m.48078 type:complete len:124 (+) Transcript_23059:261-632(+)|eukprot:CAMPEP_0172439326 /NCGR_PEP_ID=MMETSP1065-20121228/352_1 /TAXON_ID=265537 /ORGANISM="Amphiprora paludosa, Strain CCMP125" /LENGTH=123 /DNA_ID=CAMNT_0013187995 /DNA_START=252 /DNA_END=623 /DNA_ORIENTATION=-